MRVELHTEISERLAGEWRELYAADPFATPFVSPGWVLACWRHYAADARPWLLAVRSQGRLAGLAPLAMRRRRGIRTVIALAEQLGDYWDVLALPASRQEVLDEVAGEFARRAGEWDELRLTRLPPHSRTHAALARMDPGAAQHEGLVSPAIELSGTFEDYLAALPSGHRSNLRRHLRKLDQGEVTLNVVEDPGELGAAVGRWHELRVRQWLEQGRRLSPLQTDDRFRAFIGDVARELVPAQRALLWELRADGRLVGSYFNFIDASAFYWYLGGYDPGAAAVGVGKIAIGEGIRTSIAAGRGHYDFMLGAEPYKYWYGARDRRVEQLLVTSRHPRTRFAFALRAMARRVR